MFTTLARNFLKHRKKSKKNLVFHVLNSKLSAVGGKKKTRSNGLVKIPRVVRPNNEGTLQASSSSSLLKKEISPGLKKK